jgi:hypothetical protein
VTGKNKMLQRQLLNVTENASQTLQKHLLLKASRTKNVQVWHDTYSGTLGIRRIVLEGK